MVENLSRLLLLGCSQRKRLDEGTLPAIDRYDGPTFRLLRRYLRQSSILPLDVVVLSAKYGLISSDYPLPYYDQRITKEQATALHLQVITQFMNLLDKKVYTNLLICLGKAYFGALSGYEAIIPNSLKVSVAAGGMGRKLSTLHTWLYGNNLRLQTNSVSTTNTRDKKVCIKGIEVNLTQNQILDVARRGIIAGDKKATCYQSWYVSIDETRISPKWLVSQITGLSVSSFHTDIARRTLSKLGIPVHCDLD
ncbi:MAG: DUF6884 domain-containing protein [Cyanobacteria bacterium P01_D01_bin.156]